VTRVIHNADGPEDLATRVARSREVLTEFVTAAAGQLH